MDNLALENYRKTLFKLKEFNAMPVKNDRDRAGIIQAFEFTYEQSWKCIQKIAGKLGQSAPAPKLAFMVALQLGWIEPADEPSWIKMIDDRNLTSHTYKEDVAKEVLTRISGIYIPLFAKLLSKLEGLKF